MYKITICKDLLYENFIWKVCFWSFFFSIQNWLAWLVKEVQKIYDSTLENYANYFFYYASFLNPKRHVFGTLFATICAKFSINRLALTVFFLKMSDEPCKIMLRKNKKHEIWRTFKIQFNELLYTRH